MTSAYQQVFSQVFNTSSRSARSIPPLWTIDLDDEDEVKKWLVEAIGAMEPDHSSRTWIQLRNRDFYGALQSQSQGRVGYPRDKEWRGGTGNTQSRITVNKIFNLTELWVSKLTRFAPAIDVLPANNEYNDKVAAELGKLIIDNIFYLNDVESLLEMAVRCSRIFGESYVFCEWSDKKGDYAVPKNQQAGLGRVPLVDSAGNQITGKDGDILYVDTKQRIGDVDLSLVYPYYVWDEPRTYYKDVDWCIKFSSDYADNVKAKHPDKADDIQSGSFGPMTMPFTVLDSNEVAIFDIYHRSTEFLDGGRHIKMTPDCVLVNEDLPYDHGELPRARLTNIDIPGELHGVSMFNNLLMLQVMLNNLWSIRYTNLSLGSHMYWLVPNQANVSKDKLKNSATVLNYTAPYTPEIATFKTVGAELENAITEVGALLVELSGHQGLSQGDPPPGVDAAVALGVLEEQESQRANTDIKKYNAFIKKVAKLSLATAQDKYKTDDGRMMRIVGKNGRDRIKALDMSKFSGPYDVRVYRSTSLSESKSLRQQQLVQIKQIFPNAMPDNRFLDIMELGNEKEFYDIATVAIRAAEYENERFFDGELVGDPTPYEDSFVHWDGHMKWFQNIAIKTDLPPNFKKQAEDHMFATEKLMFDSACKSMTYAQKLMMLEQYPVFYVPPMPLVNVINMLTAGIPINKVLSGEIPTVGAMPLDPTGGMAPPMPGAGQEPGVTGEPPPSQALNAGGVSQGEGTGLPPLEDAPINENEQPSAPGESPPGL